MRFRPAGGLDLATGALILGGAGLVAASIIGALVVLSPSPPPPRPGATPPSPTVERVQTLPADRVATVLSLDLAAGAGGAAKSGDHVDVLGYFSRQVTGGEAVTRVLVSDVPVLSADRTASSVALTLAVRQDSALVLQEAQALGARPFVALRAVDQVASLDATLSDSDLAVRLSGAR